MEGKFLKRVKSIFIESSVTSRELVWGTSSRSERSRTRMVLAVLFCQTWEINQSNQLMDFSLLYVIALERAKLTTP